MNTETLIRLACRVDAEGKRSGMPLRLFACDPEDRFCPGGWILRLGLRRSLRLRSFGAAIRAYDERCAKLGYTTIRTAAGDVLKEVPV
jgi:hypothetical protein